MGGVGGSRRATWEAGIATAAAAAGVLGRGESSSGISSRRSRLGLGLGLGVGSGSADEDSIRGTSTDIWMAFGLFMSGVLFVPPNNL